MKDILKKALSFGVGSYYLTKEKLEEFVNDLVTKQKITPEESKKLVNDTWKQVVKFKDDQEKNVAKLVKQTLDDLGVATKKDLENLEKKLSTKKKK